MGPFSSGTVTYQRTISQHDYFAIKFLLILTNWTTNSSNNIQISVTNENGVKLASQQVSLQAKFIGQSYQEQLCSGSAVDRRVSMTLQIS
jgi:hypothetical protein